MLNNLLPSTKNDNLKLQEEIKKISEENRILKEKIQDIENNILSYLKISNDSMNTLIKESNTNVLEVLNLKIENQDIENSNKFQKLNEEIFSIVNLMNKSMFLEIVNNHKESLDKVLKIHGK